MEYLLSSPKLRSVLAGTAGFVFYGTWAYLVNSAYGVSVGIKAGLVQGSYSFLLTVSTTVLMEYLWLKLKDFPKPVLLALLATNFSTFSIAYCINWFFETPEIIVTILPGFLIGIVYSTFYLVTLSKIGILNHAE